MNKIIIISNLYNIEKLNLINDNFIVIYIDNFLFLFEI